MVLKKLIVAGIITIIIFLLYKFVLNPQIIGLQATETCPTKWKYEKPLCKPTYDTICSAFDPSKMTSKADRIAFAEQCGVKWN
jgi:hypothetical protein